MSTPVSLRSALTSSLVVRRTRLSTIGDRAFLVAASRLWNTAAECHAGVVTDCFAANARRLISRGAGTNFKVGAHVGREAPEKFSVVSLHFYGSACTKLLVVLVSAFMMHGQYSLASFLFAVRLLTVPPYSAICESAPMPHGVGATVNPFSRSFPK